MKDTSRLRRRLITALACFPISVAPVMLSGCDAFTNSYEREVMDLYGDTTLPPRDATPPPSLDTSRPPDAADTTSPPPDIDTSRPPDVPPDTTRPPDTSRPPDVADTTSPPPDVDTSRPPDDTWDTSTPPPDVIDPLSCQEGFVQESSSEDFCQWGHWTLSVDEAWALATENGNMPAERLGCPTDMWAKAPPGHEEVDPWSEGLWLWLEDGFVEACLDQGEHLCIYYWESQCALVGRALSSEDDGAVLAGVRPGRAWLSNDPSSIAAHIDALSPALRAEIAGGWLQDARAEHASVASFARAALELISQGAPPSLIAAAQRAAIDEIDHARRCFTLAALYSGDAHEAGLMVTPPPRRCSLAQLAVDTFIEGCVGETVAILLATRSLEFCAVPAAREALEVILEDETRHAALAWATVAWAAERGGAPVVEALRDAAMNLHAAGAPNPARSTRSDAERASLAAHGRLEWSDRKATFDDAWREIIAPMLTRVGV